MALSSRNGGFQGGVGWTERRKEKGCGTKGGLMLTDCGHFALYKKAVSTRNSLMPSSFSDNVEKGEEKLTSESFMVKSSYTP